MSKAKMLGMPSRPVRYKVLKNDPFRKKGKKRKN